MRELTDRQREVLEWMKMYVRKQGRAPTRTEISEAFGWRDSTSARGHLEALEKKGHIEILEDKYRGIRILQAEVPLIGRLAEVAAGRPIVAEEHIVERVAAGIADRFQPRPDYLLTVRGDSMDRTVRDGDVVAVRKTPEADTGQVVVARFGDEVTLKRFVRIDERHIELHPESYNEAHEVLKIDLAKHIIEIDGVVVGALVGELRDPGKVDRSQPRRLIQKDKV